MRIGRWHEGAAKALRIVKITRSSLGELGREFPHQPNLKLHVDFARAEICVRWSTL